ncbi:aminoglycoside phosphotransferase family protein [Acrocarpospora catenulata]|uniref:aminoglycoside phosphotransferase family protein n=1 Tax=Acrocarpospora catenulata TaxID=2836182 RepID=UPI001BD93F71|nr:aminoglycoside phosphotransferase family protein [Acrocarpospora catenulata]
MQSGGFTPGIAVRLAAVHGRVFVKAVPADHDLAPKYRAEAAVAARLPHATPAPRLRWTGDLDGWVVLVFDDVPGRHPDLSPDSPDVPIAVAGVAGLAATLTPSPADAPPAPMARGGLLHGWGELLRDSARDKPDTGLGPWERDRLPLLAELEKAWVPRAEGWSLVHGDIRPDNLLIRDGDGALMVIDWAQPSIGAPWQDVLDLIPHMIMAGHEPRAAEKALIGVPAWEELPAEVVTSYAAAYAGYWTRMSRQPPPPGVPHLRAYQTHAARAALMWTHVRLL